MGYLLNLFFLKDDLDTPIGLLKFKASPDAPHKAEQAPKEEVDTLPWLKLASNSY